MSKITYLVVGENPLSGIFKSQMYGAYEELDDYDKEMADRSISRVESLLQQIEGHIKN